MLKELKNVNSVATVFVNHKGFLSNVELYDNETGFSFIDDYELVICGYDNPSIETMKLNMEDQIAGLNDKFQMEAPEGKSMYTFWEFNSDINGDHKHQAVSITFNKGSDPKVEWRAVTKGDDKIKKIVSKHIIEN